MGRDEDETAAKRVDVAAARAQFEDAVATHVQDFQTFFLARLLGLSFEFWPAEVDPTQLEGCRVAFPVRDFVYNPHGIAHGGVVATVLDVSMGHLVNKVCGPSATLEIKVQYLRPLTIQPAPAVAQAQFLRRGRSVSFTESRLSDGVGRLVATATATWRTTDAPSA